MSRSRPARRRARGDRRRPRRDHRTTSPTLRQRVERGAELMAVVKADGYGHGMVESARAARAGGADWLGVAVLEEALALRAAGDTGRLLCWLTVPGEDYAAAVEAGVDVDRVHRPPQLDEIAAAARSRRPPGPGAAQDRHRPARGGATEQQWPALVEAAADAEQAGGPAGHRHLVALRLQRRARTTRPTTPQERAFVHALKVVDAVGLEPEVRHLANSAGALLRPWSTLRPGALRASRRTASRRPPTCSPPPSSACVPAMTARGPAGAGQAGRRPARRLLRAHLDRRARHAPRRWCRSGTATGSRGTRPRPRDGARRRRAARRIAGPGLHGPVRRRPRRRPRRAAGDEVVLFGDGARRRADRPGLGRGLRHHLLRDRHPDRAAGSSAGTSRRTGTGGRDEQRDAGSGSPRPVPAPPRRPP